MDSLDEGSRKGELFEVLLKPKVSVHLFNVTRLNGYKHQFILYSLKYKKILLNHLLLLSLPSTAKCSAIRKVLCLSRGPKRSFVYSV